MRAQFRLSSDLTIQVESETLPGGPSSVRLVTFRGTCFDHQLHDEACKERVTNVYTLDKHEARAIGSAIMGCAAVL